MKVTTVQRVGDIEVEVHLDGYAEEIIQILAALGMVDAEMFQGREEGVMLHG